jgi:hypothetical protein
MQTRVRKKGQMTDRTVGNMVWAEYIHFTSRPVDGVPDPHLHAHCFVYNTVYDPEERRWKAGKFRDLKEDAPRFQKEFQKRFAERLVRLGYPIAWKGENFEIAGVDRAMIDRFSRRTIRINELARQQGLTSPRLKDQLGAKTREHKRNSIPLPRLRELWGRRLTPRDEGVLAIATARRRFTTVGVDGSYRPYGSLSRSQYDVATSRSAVRRVPASSLPPGLAERQRRTGLKLYRGEECDEPPPVAAMVIPFPSPGHGR